MDHCAPPRGPEGNSLGVPRNEEGIYRPESWEQWYALMIGMLTGAIPVEKRFDLSLLPKVLTADEIVASEPHMTAPVEKWWRDVEEVRSMTNRKAEVTCLSDGTYQLKGVAYVADEPNVNGVIYPKDVLEKALTKFLAKDFRPVTFGCVGLPKLADVIGEVVSGEIVGNELRLELRTVPTHWASYGVKMRTRMGDIAFAGAGIGDVDEDTKALKSFKIDSIGLVGVAEVEPKE